MSTTIEDLITLNSPEVRTYNGVEFRDAEGSGKWLEGRAVPYNSWQDVGFYMENHAPRSFAKSIKEAGFALPLLTFHNERSFPIGKVHRWTEKEDGLDGVWEIDTKDSDAVKAAGKARDGYLNGLSIGFLGIQAERSYDAEAGLSYVKRLESRLGEVSLVSVPAFVGAKVTMVRSREMRINGMGGGGSSGVRRSAELSAAKEWLERNRTI